MASGYHLNDFLTSLTEKYHEYGHGQFLGFKSLPTSESVNKLIDSAAGRGHRIREGHDFDGLIDSFQEDGIQGAATWFDHMLKDFTSPDGIPLPGADIATKLGMSTTDSIDWLCINASDVLEVGGAAGAMKLLESKFRNNPKLEKTCLAVGGALGIVDDNPVLVAYVALKTAQFLHKKRIVNDRMARVFVRTARSTGSIVKYTSVGTLAGVSLLACVGVDVLDYLESAEAAGMIADGLDGAEMAAEGPALAGDVLDGLSTLGLSIVLSYGVRHLFKLLSKADMEKLKSLRPKFTARNTIKEFAGGGKPPALLAQAIEKGSAEGVYRRRLWLE